MNESPRLRPRFHFTAREGSTNDPHGIVRVDGKYHLFFQHNPVAVQWSPKTHWGHALSDDLITWVEADVALSPSAGEVGCWSGSVVVDDRGPVIVYTSIIPEDWRLGRVVLARPSSGMSGWVRDPAHPVIDRPPRDLDVVAFRDPHVRRENGDWKAVLGAGLADSDGCALQYSSKDLENWIFDGILARRGSDEIDRVSTGHVWECPQLLQVGVDWVMIISAWEDGVPRDVNYAVGVYDGRAFTARRYGRLTHGAELYATTTFRDVAGRPCAMSWLRERNNVAPEGSPWCSAMSLPHVLSIKNGELTVAQHPNLELALAKTYPLADTPSGGKLDIAVPGPVWRLRFRAACDQPGSFSVIVTGDGQSFAVNAAGDSLAVADADGTTLLTMPLSPTHAHDVDVVVDADILELTVTGTEGIAATRIPVTGAGHIRISTDKGCSLTDATLSTPRRN